MSENIYLSWDSFAARPPDGVPCDVKTFLADYLQRESQTTKLPLKPAQSEMLVELACSYVDEASKRHLAYAKGEDGASRDWATELQTPLYEEKDQKKDAGLAALFRRIKMAILSRTGKKFGTELAAHVDASERQAVERLFTSSVQNDEWARLKQRLLETGERQGEVALERVRGLLAAGARASEIETILAEPDGEEGGEPAAKCLAEALGSELFSPSEQLVRKLAAIDFLLALMDPGEVKDAEEQPTEAELPFLAVGAARYAYDWLTGWKTTIQEGELTWAENALGVSGTERGAE